MKLVAFTHAQMIRDNMDLLSNRVVDLHALYWVGSDPEFQVFLNAYTSIVDHSESR